MTARRSEDILAIPVHTYAGITERRSEPRRSEPAVLPVTGITGVRALSFTDRTIHAICNMVPEEQAGIQTTRSSENQTAPLWSITELLPGTDGHSAFIYPDMIYEPIEMSVWEIAEDTAAVRRGVPVLNTFPQISVG